MTLDNGTTYLATPNVKFANFKAGDHVTLSYFKSGNRLDMTGMTRAG